MFTDTDKILDLPDIKLIFDLLDQYSNSLFVVGGVIRDSFISKFNSNYDIDFTINAQIQDIYEYINSRLQNQQFNNIDINIDSLNYGVIRLIIRDKKYDITMFRNDLYKNGSRYPVVEYTNSMIQDSKRRDFTVNAIYLNNNNELFDPTNEGIKDLKNKQIRFITDKEKDDNMSSGILRRIVEDPIRIIRYIRIYLKFFPKTYDCNIPFNGELSIIDFCKDFLQNVISYDQLTIGILLKNIVLLKLIGINKLKSEVNKILTD